MYFNINQNTINLKIGITVAILDDGVDYLHPDIAPNYSPEGITKSSKNG